MLSSKTYAIWNVTIAIAAILFGLTSIGAGQHAVGTAEFFVALIFVVYAVMAWFGWGMYKKHPTTIKPSGEIVAKEVVDKPETVR